MIILILSLLLGLIILGAISVFGMNLAVVRKEKPLSLPGRSISNSRFDIMFKNDILNGQKWIETIPFREEEIISFDSTKLYGRFYENNGSKTTVLLMHGYRSGAMHDFSCAFKYYFDKGFNLLVPDQRAHGKSGGKFITYGIKERFDAKCWMEHINKIVEGGTIYANGVSMGASTLLMATGLELPENLKGIIADCGFTSPAEIIKKVIKEDMKLPLFPIYYTTRILTKIVAGFDFEEYSAVTAVKNSPVPILFLHGKSDEFVPFYMGEEIYNATKSEKKAVWVENADHGCSFMTDRDTCLAEIYNFLGV